MNLFLELISGKIFTKYCSHFKLYSQLRRKSKHDTFDRVQISRKEQQHECKCIIQSQNSYFLNKFLADCATYQLAENHKGFGFLFTWESKSTDISNRKLFKTASIATEAILQMKDFFRDFLSGAFCQGCSLNSDIQPFK